MAITHIFFDLHGTLADSKRMAINHRLGLGKIMSERYGKSPDIWQEAYQRIVADWDSYFADLNLSGDDMMRDLKEGWFRITRALFRLAEMPEPKKSEISELSMEILTTAPAYGNSLYDDARPVIEQLYEKGFHLGIVTHALEGLVRATLKGAKVLDYFSAPIIGVDTIEQFDKDKMFFIKSASVAKVQPKKCLVVDDNQEAISSAKSAGMKAIHINRHSNNSPDSITGLSQLLNHDLLK